jgi:hypothetical protein
VGCGPGARDAVPDAAGPDAYVCIDHTPYAPVDVPVISPQGPLTSLRYMFGIAWTCGHYDVDLVERTGCEEGSGLDLDQGPDLLLGIAGDVTAPGSVVPASVTYGELYAMGWFHVLSLDREAIIGRFLISGGGWNIDLAVDLQPTTGSCTL